MRRAAWLAMVLLLSAVALNASPACADSAQPGAGLPPVQPSAGAAVPGAAATLGSPGEITSYRGGPARLRFGAQLYADHCSSCHGDHLQGSLNAPPLLHDGAAGADFYLRTGRMPAAVPGAQMTQQQPHLTLAQIDALVAFVAAHSDGPPIPQVQMGNHLANGRRLYADNCAACHGPGARGAIVGYGWSAPSLMSAPVTQVAEAVRIGPGVMPRFDEKAISQRDLNDLVRYVNTLQTNPPHPGGLALDDIGPVAEGAISAIIGLGVLVGVIRFIGTAAHED